VAIDANYQLTPHAESHFKEIGKYTKEKRGAKQRNKYLAGLCDCFHSLGNRPNAGKDRSEIKKGCRSKIYGSHVIFYIINEASIKIIAIHHVRDDLEVALGIKQRESSDDSHTPWSS